jgi:flagellin
MQRLASGQQNIAPGDRTASSAVAWGMKAEAASLKIGMQNGTEALQAVEMLNNDIQAMNDIVVRLEELYALSTNSFNTTEDNVAIENEATKLLSEISRIATDAKWKGNAMVSGSTINTIGFGRNGGTLSVYVADLAIPNSVAVGGTNTLTGKDIAGTNTSANDNPIASEMVSALSNLKQNVDTMSINAGALYNEVTNVLSHLGSLNAGYALDVSSKMDVDFAGETTELAKGQILAQAGTAMLAQANAQGQGMLALIQS